MLLTNLQSRHQSSAQHLSESHKSRNFCQKNYALVLLIFYSGLISFSPSCQAQEKAALPKSYITTASSKISNPSPSKLYSILWWHIAERHQLDPYIFAVDRDTVSGWLKAWEQHGLLAFVIRSMRGDPAKGQRKTGHGCARQSKRHRTRFGCCASGSRNERHALCRSTRCGAG
jgi:hypothetical protein